MSAPLRLAAYLSLRVFLCAFVLTLSANAIVVRGTVTDGLGHPVRGARVQLIQGPTTSAFAYAETDGTFEILSNSKGRFILLTAAPSFAPNIGEDFYGDRSDVVIRNIILDPTSITQSVTVTATGLPTPLEQVSAAITLIPKDDLLTRVGIIDQLRQSPGVHVVQSGQAGGVTSLFVRGGNSDANKILIDGIPAEDVGGRFDFGTVSSTGIAGLEIHRGPDSAIYGSDAEAGVIAFNTPRGATLKPVLTYSGDAGTLHSYRNEFSLSGTRSRLDYLGAFSRFDTSNAIPMDRYHSATAGANVGFNLTSNTQARFTLRDAVSASGLPNAYDIFNVVAAGKEGDQDLYSGFTMENRFAGKWHNLLRYGIARKREQAIDFYPVGEAVTAFGFTTYFGNAVNIRGANGYTATGRAAIAFGGKYPMRNDFVSNRDELYYQTDYAFGHHVTALGSFRYENERGVFLDPSLALDQRLQRTNFEYTLQLQGDLKNRVFYSLGGAVVKNHLFGVEGSPRLGLSYVPFTRDWHHFSGTRLRFNFAKGIQEPSLSTDFTSLYGQLQRSGNAAAIAAYNVRPITAARSRTYEFGVDQSFFGKKLVLKAGVFHNQFDHQVEYVSSSALKKYFGLTGTIPNFYGALLTSQAYRAQGIETELQYQPRSRLFLRGGYTYLATRVEQSFSSDVLSANGGFPITNPNLPGIPIGSTTPLLGGRVFRRPPHTGFVAVQYTGTRFSTALQGALASRSDDSTFQLYNDFNFDNTLLLPNRNLDFGYAKLDLSGTYNATHQVAFFTQLENLLNQQHIGPIGYPGLPLTVRLGVKLRLGGD